MAKKNPTVKSLKNGQTVHYVHDLGVNSFTVERKLTGQPFLSHGLGYFVNYENDPLGNGFSLKDCNVVPNSYNGHRLFYSRGKAETYRKRCLTGRGLSAYLPS